MTKDKCPVALILRDVHGVTDELLQWMIPLPSGVDSPPLQEMNSYLDLEIESCSVVRLPLFRLPHFLAVFQKEENQNYASAKLEGTSDTCMSRGYPSSLLISCYTSNLRLLISTDVSSSRHRYINSCWLRPQLHWHRSVWPSVTTWR